MSTSEREAWVVLDLGFGDAGKGGVTDFLVRDRGAQLVVRFNGGAQAGHNVVAPDGRHHAFSQFCAGTFAGCAGLLGPDFLLHPLGMHVEAQHLEAVGVRDPWALTEVDGRARVITPYQQAACRARELSRGAAAHGTTGVGVGECASDSLSYGDDTLRARDLADERSVRRCLRSQRGRKRAELQALGIGGLELFDDSSLEDRVVTAWRDVAAKLQILPPDRVHARIAEARCVVFEGAQGVLLDETWGFHPHTTWSDCTAAGALALAGDRRVHRLGLTRGYAVRHGAGPLPTEGSLALDEPHNSDQGWQGQFRVGALDGVLLRYALEVCGGVDGLAVTCLDRVAATEGALPVVCDAYLGEAPAGLARGGCGRVRSLVPGARDELEHRERLARWLFGAVPEYQRREVLPFVEAATGCAVWLESWGPGAGQKRWVRIRGEGVGHVPSAPS